MSHPSGKAVEAILEDSLRRCQDFRDELLETVEGVFDTIGSDTCRRLAPGIDEDVDRLEDAVDQLEEATDNPEVVIAVTGTTSAGKSTLANLLIGARLLPKAVQEMSAGVVRIQHTESSPELVVKETGGATWTTGTWKTPSEEEVRERLRSVMEEYRRSTGRTASADSSSASERPAPPEFIVRWPTRMGSRCAEFGIPEGADLTIVDLPGLKHINDDLTGGLVREQTREALSVVAYNAVETDPEKQESLLQEVVDQVKALGGSPARMLFVLNRIDAYLKDPDPEASEKQFTDHVTAQIRSEIQKELPEHTEEAEAIEPIPLSSEPALYALLARSADEKPTDLLQRIDREYRLLLPDELMELPRRSSEWSEAQTRWFIDETLRQSRFEGFKERLAGHVSDNLPHIILPGLLDDIYKAGRNLLQTLDAILNSYEKTKDEELEEAYEHLNELHQNLKATKDEALSTLAPLREALESDDLTLPKIMEAVPEVEKSLDLGGGEDETGELAPLRDALNKAIVVPIRRLNDYTCQLMDGKGADDAYVESAPSIDQLHTAVETLRSSPYGDVWEEGGSFEGEEADEVKEALSMFGRAISSVSTELIQDQSAVQAERVEDALTRCLDSVIDFIEENALENLESIKSKYPGLEGAFRGKFRVSEPKLPGVEFSPDVKNWAYVEKREETKTYRTKERKWYYLWLAKGKTKKTKTRTVREKHEGVKVDGFERLLSGFEQSNNAERLESRFAGWIMGELKEFDEVLSDRLSDGITKYRKALQERRETLEEEKESRVQEALQFEDNIEALSSTADSLRNWEEVSAYA